MATHPHDRPPTPWAGNGPAAEPTGLQRNGVQVLFLGFILLSVLTAPMGLWMLYAGIADLRNAEAIHAYTGTSMDSIVFGSIVRMVVFTGAFVVCVVLAIVFGRRRKRQVFSAKMQRLEDGLSALGRGLWVVIGPVVKVAPTIITFVCALGALYGVLGFGSAFVSEDEATRDIALGLLMPADPVVLAWTIPGIILGIISRKMRLWMSGLAMAGMIICIICLVLSFTKVAVLLQFLVRGLVLAFTS